MNTVKTSDILSKLEIELQTVRTVREQVHMDLEDDARIEDLQERYRDLVQNKYAQYMTQYFEAKKRAPFCVIMKCEELCREADALYRLVK